MGSAGAPARAASSQNRRRPGDYCPGVPPAPPGDTRDSAPHLVRRRRELSWLRSRLDLATRGYGHLVLVEGDAGIGKTRLVEEFLLRARSAGVAGGRGRLSGHPAPA